MLTLPILKGYSSRAIFALLLLHSVIIPAQEEYIYHIDEALTSTMVYDILQDEEGFIWIATDNGFCRYDGREFKTEIDEIMIAFFNI